LTKALGHISSRICFTCCSTDERISFFFPPLACQPESYQILEVPGSSQSFAESGLQKIRNFWRK